MLCCHACQSVVHKNCPPFPKEQVYFPPLTDGSQPYSSATNRTGQWWCPLCDDQYTAAGGEVEFWDPGELTAAVKSARASIAAADVVPTEAESAEEEEEEQPARRSTRSSNADANGKGRGKGTGKRKGHTGNGDTGGSATASGGNGSSGDRGKRARQR